MQTQAPIRYACAASGGSNGLDARFTNAFSVKDCRTSATAASLIRRPTDVRPNASGDAPIEVPHQCSSSPDGQSMLDARSRGDHRP